MGVGGDPTMTDPGRERERESFGIDPCWEPEGATIP